MNNVPPYNDMKDSKIKWIGHIPCEWNISRLGSLYVPRNEKVSDKDYKPLSVTMRGVVPQLATVAKTDDGDNRKLVCKGDFVINSRSDRRGSCGISPLDGSVSLINTVLTPLGKMHPGYYDWLFHTAMFADEFYQWGHGIVDDLWTTRWQEMKQILVPVPPLAEQEKISAYLDVQCSKIDALIANSKSVVDELKQWQASIIQEAVTQGLAANVQKKSSQLEWIEEIPIHWGTARLKAIFTFGKGLPITKENLVESGVAVISYGQIHSKENTGTHVAESLIRYVSEDYLATNPESLVKKNDFILADTSEDLEGCGNCVYIDTDETLFAGYHTIILRSINKRNNKYLSYLFKSATWRSQIRSRVSGVKLFSISRKILGLLTVLLPPEEEQDQIVRYLDNKCELINSIIKEKELLIFELEEYKRSFIYETVTGKRKAV